ncbi:hypothetical protein [Bacillus salipaludis]|uniref:hypothetical protein n=1 Tax=Bacillus salipaludis TaxID=2547811 RepID=UPI002E1CE56E|nr:hypothetical protein [Bacillus salipaludis]
MVEEAGNGNKSVQENENRIKHTPIMPLFLLISPFPGMNSTNGNMIVLAKFITSLLAINDRQLEEDEQLMTNLTYNLVVL